jgi:hypothetical protein
MQKPQIRFVIVCIMVVYGTTLWSQPCPLITSSSISQDIIVGGTMDFMATGTGGSGSCILKLEIRSTAPNSMFRFIGSVSGAPNKVLSGSTTLTPDQFPEGDYIARFTYECDGPGCVADIVEYPLVISNAPRIISYDLPPAICLGGQLDFNAMAIGGSGNCTLKLEIRSTAPNSMFAFLASVSGGPDKTLNGFTTLAPLQYPAGNYELRLSYDCDMDTSPVNEILLDLEIVDMPAILDAMVTPEICEGGRIDFEASAGCGLGSCSLGLHIRRKEPNFNFVFLASFSGSTDLNLSGSTTLSAVNYPPGIYEIRFTYSCDGNPFPPVEEFLDIIIHSLKPELIDLGPDTIFTNAQCEGILPDYRDSTTVIDFCNSNPVLSQTPPPGTNLGNVGGNTLVTIIATNAYGLSDTIIFPVVVQDINPDNQLNCRDIRLGLDENGMARFQLHEIVPGANCTVPHELIIENSHGSPLMQLQNLYQASEIVIPACDLIGTELTAIVKTGDGQSCWSTITFSENSGPVLEAGRNVNLWCLDEKIGNIQAYEDAYGKPVAHTSCNENINPDFVADWINPYFDCNSDTVKIILREYEAFDKNGKRGSVFDTLIIYRLPQIDPANTFCGLNDTLNCGINQHPVSNDPNHPMYGYYYIGPYTILPEIPGSTDGPCDTIWYCAYRGGKIVELLPKDNKCGLSLHKKVWDVGNSCTNVFKVDLALKQSCFGTTEQNNCTVAGSNLQQIGEGYWNCQFWVIDQDTVAPNVICQIQNYQLLDFTQFVGNCDTFMRQAIIIETSQDDCAANLRPPGVKVLEQWSGIEQVKAQIGHIGTYILQFNPVDSIYEFTDYVTLPIIEEPYKITYTAVDACHNIGTGYCFIYLKDKRRPEAITNKGMTVSLSDKKVWVPASSFDEGSIDNCAVNLLLARRSDWHTAGVDLCDSLESIWIGAHHDTLKYPLLSSDKILFPVENHYKKQLEWLRADEGKGNQLVYNAWQYDLLRYGSLSCPEASIVSNEALFKKNLLTALKDPLASAVWDKFSSATILDSISLHEPAVNNCSIDQIRLGGQPGDMYYGPTCNTDSTYRTCFYISGDNLPASGSGFELMINGANYPIDFAATISSSQIVICVDGLQPGLTGIDVEVKLITGCCFSAIDLYDAPPYCPNPDCEITDIRLGGQVGDLYHGPICNQDGTFSTCFYVTGIDLPANTADFAIMVNEIEYPIDFITVIDTTEIVICVSGLQTGLLDCDVSVHLLDHCEYTAPDLFDAPATCPDPNCPISEIRIAGQPGDVYIGPACNGDGTFRTCFYVTGTNLPNDITSYSIFIDGVSYPPAFVQALSPNEVVICATNIISSCTDCHVIVEIINECSLLATDVFDAPDCGGSNCISDFRLAGQPGDQYIGPTCNNDGTYRTCFYISGPNLPGQASSYQVVINGNNQVIAFFQLLSPTEAVVCISGVPADQLPADVTISLANCSLTKEDLYITPDCSCTITSIRTGGQPGDQYIGPTCNNDGTYRTTFYITGSFLPGDISEYMVFIDGVEYPVTFFQQLSGGEIVVGLSSLPATAIGVDVMVVAGANCSLTLNELYDAPSCPAMANRRSITSPDEQLFIAESENHVTEYFGDFTEEELVDQIDSWAAIGGGWSDAVPFSCDDACGPVTVEILVMDYWCNWSTAWTKVWVEDKTPVKVVKDVSEQEAITCKVYKENNYSYPGEEHPVSLEYIVEQAKLGTPEGLAALNGIFGGYRKAWVDPYGHFVDSNGVEIEGSIPFYDSICECKKEWKQVRVYDEHLGYLWVDSLVTECYYEADTLEFWNGIVAVNCAENVYCEQEVWCEFDHCGQGYIFRKFKIWSSCAEATADSAGHIPDTIYRHQRIWVGNECELSKYMFDRPYDTEVYTCNIEYGADGNVIGDAGPENTGYPVYQFDDDCRIVGIAHEDKVFKIVGGDAACYKILRTWYFADWCGYGGDRPVGKWWLDDGLVIDKYVQQIIVIDTVGPRCVLTGPVQTGDTVETGACEYELVVTVDASDACGLTSYYWELKDFSDPDDGLFIDSGDGSLAGEEETAFDIVVSGLAPGTYKLLVTLRDECNNESYCEYTVVIQEGKKPTPVCISSLTARLTPWDSDNDGEIDTAHAVVWAYEFDRSSTPACGDDSLEYRIEFLEGNEEDENPAGDLDYLDVGCAHIGTRLVRMWVISHPSLTSDYCDVVLVVQSDFTGCVPTVGGGDVMTYQENMTHPTNRPVLDRMGGDVEGIHIAGDAGLSTGWSPGDFTLYQNRPNPFQHETVIGFYLPEATEATLTVYDVTGQRLKVYRRTCPKGYSEIAIRYQDLGVTGILYYQLDTPNFVAAKKMIAIQ